MHDILFEKTAKYEIFIGIKDKDSYEELLTVEDFKKMLEEICTEEKISFSLLTQFGGYSHNKGYTTETSLRVVILGIDEEEAARIGTLLKQRVNTDTVMISKTDVEFAFV